jgi:hypothetical protein
MKLNKRQQEVRINLCELKLTLQKAINKHCKENPNTTCVEVNTALVDVLNSSLCSELKELWQTSDE